MGAKCPITGVKTSISGQVLGRVGLCSTRLIGIIEFGRMQGHELSGVELRPALGQRVLDRLVLPNGTPKHLPFLGVGHAFGQSPSAHANHFGGIQDALGIETV